MNTIRDSLRVIALSSTVLLLVGVAYAWTEPSSSPPSSNTSKPLTTQGAQIVEGGLTLGNNSSVTTGLVVRYGNVGIGTISPYAILESKAPTTGAYNTSFRGRSNDGNNHIDLNILNDGTANFGGNFTNFSIGTTMPGQQNLTVDGVIESTSGGIKFPDGTIQTTATTSTQGCQSATLLISDTSTSRSCTYPVNAQSSGYSEIACCAYHSWDNQHLWANVGCANSLWTVSNIVWSGSHYGSCPHY